MEHVTEKAPIVFFAYNRPEHTRLSLESLAANEGAKESELFIFCDGPKNPRDEEAVSEVRSLVKNRNWCGKVHVIEHDRNRGLADSIIAGVTEVVNRFGRVIVLEDDLVLSPQFLNFMNDALEIYKDPPKVMHISGYMFPVKANLPETFFYRAVPSWGWATWRHAWDKLETNAEVLLSGIRETGRRWEFDLEGSFDFYKMLKDQAGGRIDSWAIRWAATVFLNHGLCLYPGESLVHNIGHDSSGTHCSPSEAYDTVPSQTRISNFSISVEENAEIVRTMSAYFQSIKKPLSSKIFAVARRVLGCR